MSLAEANRKATLAEFTAFAAQQPEERRYELIDGVIYAMASPSTAHQAVAGLLYRKIAEHLEGKPCNVFIAPLDVYFEEENGECENVLQPDVFVVCDKKKIGEDGIHGAPDFVIEVASPSTLDRDYLYKSGIYFRLGVREYWIVNPKTRQVTVYTKANDTFETCSHTFNDTVKSGLFENLYIDFKVITEAL